MCVWLWNKYPRGPMSKLGRPVPEIWGLQLDTYDPNDTEDLTIWHGWCVQKLLQYHRVFLSLVRGWYVCVNIHVYVYIYIYIRIFKYIYIYIRIFKYIYIYISIYIHYIHMCVWVWVFLLFNWFCSNMEVTWSWRESTQVCATLQIATEKNSQKEFQVYHGRWMEIVKGSS